LLVFWVGLGCGGGGVGVLGVWGLGGLGRAGTDWEGKLR